MTERRVIIHAGMPKCGSSSIQVALASNRDALAQAGFDYPDLRDFVTDEQARRDVGHVSHMLLAHELTLASVRGADRPCRMLRAVVDRFRGSGHHTLILSAESFVMRAGEYSAAAWGDLLAGFRVELLVFLRRHDRWFLSFYKQAVKGSRRRYASTLDDFLADPPVYAEAALEPDVCGQLARLRDVTGAAAVHAHDLDAGAGDAVAITGELLGVPLGEWALDPKLLMPYNAALVRRGLPINQSLSDGATVVLAMANAIALDGLAPSVREFSKFKGALVKLDRDGALPAISLLSADVSARLLGGAAPDRAGLARRFGLPRTPVEPVREEGDRRQWLPRVEWVQAARQLTRMLDGPEQERWAAIVQRGRRVLA